MGLQAVNQTFQNTDNIVPGSGVDLNKQKFSKLILELARSKSSRPENHSRSRRGGLCQAFTTALSNCGFLTYSNTQNNTSTLSSSQQQNQMPENASSVKVQFFGENHIIFHNQKMMKKLVKKELLGHDDGKGLKA